MSIFRRLFGSTPPAPPLAQFDIPERRVSELSGQKDLLLKIRGREQDGVLVKGLLNAEEVAQALAGLKEIGPLTHVQPGLSTYPMAFSQAAQMMDSANDELKSYFKHCEGLQNEFHRHLGVDVLGRIKAVLQDIAEGIEIDVSRLSGYPGQLAELTVRFLQPGTGRLKPHCENYFFKEFGQLFSNLNIEEVFNPVSFFLLLQTPPKGGDIVLYDLEWKDAEKRIGDEEVETKKGKRHRFEALPQVALPVEAGDLLIFAGGEIWHQVSPPEALPARISMGGFISLSPSLDRLYLWT